MTTRTVAGVNWRKVAADCWEGEAGRVNVSIMGERGRYVLDADRTVQVDDLRYTSDGEQVELRNRERFKGNLTAAMTRCVELAEGIGLGMLHRAIAKLEAEKKRESP